MPRGLKRYYGKGDLHFITFSCYRKLPFLGTKRARGVFGQELARVRVEVRVQADWIRRDADHVHLLKSEPVKGDAFDCDATFEAARCAEDAEEEEGLAALDSWNSHLARPSRMARHSGRRRFYDFNVYKTGKVKEKLNYMHANPVDSRAGGASERLAVE